METIIFGLLEELLLVIQYNKKSKRVSNFTLVEEVLDIYDGNRCWYYIPGFNGYEISNDGYIRSMKHYKKYPYGLLIKPRKDGKFELSDNNNQRVTVTRSELLRLAQTNPYQITGYPRSTLMTDIAPRNQSYFIKKPQSDRQFDKTPRAPRFTIIPDGQDSQGKICPISSMDGSETHWRRKII